MLYPDKSKAPTQSVHELSPWIDLRVPPKNVKMPEIEEQKGRRFLKTHLPLNAIPYYKNVKYVYVARAGLDMFMSLFNHYKNANEIWYGLLNGPGLVGDKIPQCPEDIHEAYADWVSKGWPSLPKDIETQGYPFWSVLQSIKSYWDFKDLPNIAFIHYANMLKDLKGELKKLAKYLEIEISDKDLENAVAHCGFESMKKDGDKMAPLGGVIFKGGGKTFINKGTNGRWKGVLSEKEIEAWQKRLKELPDDCAKFMETGEYPAN